jgi:predicted transcriptional regulator
MTVRRSWLEIYVDVLKTIRSGVNKPTLIRNRCNLAWKPFMGILGTLISNDLVVAVEGSSRKTYKLTDKGVEFLRQFESAEAFIAHLKGQRSTVDALNLP